MLEVIKLFVRRMLMGKGKGILQIPPQNKVDDFALLTDEVVMYR